MDEQTRQKLKKEEKKWKNQELWEIIKKIKQN